MHSLQGCFFAVFIEGNMPGYHNSKCYAKSLKRNKVQSHNITKLFKRSRSENTANETHEIQDDQQTVRSHSRATRRGSFFGSHRSI